MTGVASNYKRLKSQLEHAVTVDVPVSKFADLLSALDPPPHELNSRADTGLALGLAWIPQRVPVTVHLYIDQKPIPGASGTFEGGLLRFSVPENLYHPGARLTAVLRFFEGGWKYQLWSKLNGVAQQITDGKDPDPSNPTDDLFVKSYTLP